MCLYLISISSHDDDQCVNIQYLISISSNDFHCFYILHPYQEMTMINISISHIHIKQWWSSIYLYLISISSIDDDHCVNISYPYQAMITTTLSMSHIHIKQWWWWSMFPYIIFLIFEAFINAYRVFSFFILSNS